MSTSSDIVPAGPAGLPTQTPFTVDNTLGAVVIGFAVSCVVYGILLTQGWVYFNRFPLDSLVYKFLVVVIIILETADQLLIGHFIYFYSVVKIGNPLAVITGTTTWSLILQQTVGSAAGVIVKCAFAFRVYRFSNHNLFILIFGLLLSAAQLVTAFLFTLRAFSLQNIPQVFHLKTLASIALGLEVFTDVYTAATLCFYLRRLRNGQKKIDSLVRILVIDTINNGVLTSVVSIATLILFDFYTGNLFFSATFFLLSKLYAISFLATLNTRSTMRARVKDPEIASSLEDGSHGFAVPGMREQKAQIETNIFAAGTRIPSIHEGYEPELPPPQPNYLFRPPGVTPPYDYSRPPPQGQWNPPEQWRR